MIFSTIEDEATKSGYKITNIFQLVKKEIESATKKTSGIHFSSDFQEKIKTEINSLDALRNKLSQVSDKQAEYNAIRKNYSDIINSFVEKVGIDNLDGIDLATFIRQDQISKVAKDTSLGNVKKLIDEYNLLSTHLNNCGLNQTQFIEAVSQSNPILAKTLFSLNGADASMSGYIKTLVGAKAATIGLQVATAALNIGLTMLIGAVVSSAAGAISDYIHREEILIEKSEEAASAISSISDRFKESSNTVSNISERFAELAQEVDLLNGKNKSLSTEEYDEFLNLSNQLADTFPALTRIYDENGNAIVQLSGNTDTMVSSLHDLLDAQRQMMNLDIAENLPDLYAGIKVQSDNYNDTIDELTAQRDALSSELAKLQIGDIGDQMKLALEAGMISVRDETGNVDHLIDTTNQYLSILRELGLEVQQLDPIMGANDQILGFDYKITSFEGMTDDEIAKAKENISIAIHNLSDHYSKEISKLNTQIQSTLANNQANWSGLSSSLSAWLETNDLYGGLNDQMRSVVQRMVANIDFSNLDFAEWGGVEGYIEAEILAKIQSATPEVQNAFADLMSISSLDKSVSRYINEITSQAQAIAEASAGAFSYEEILSNSGYDDIIKQYQENVNGLIEVFTENFNVGKSARILNEEIDLIKENLYNLSPDQLTKALDLVRNYGIKTWDDLHSALVNKTFEIPLEINVESEGLAKVTAALEESASATGLTDESVTNLTKRYQDLESYNIAELFEETANGIHLNAEAYRELESAYEKQNKDAIDKKLKGLAEHYNSLTREIRSTSDINERINLYAQRDNIVSQIKDTSALAAHYNALTSEYNKWLQAQSSTNERDTFEGFMGAKADIEDRISRGWIDDDVRAYVDMLSSEDLANATDKAILDAYKKAGEKIAGSDYSVWDFFKVDSEGNMTTEGIYNFFDTLIAAQKEAGKEWIKTNQDGTFELDFGIGGDQEVADQLGISLDLLHAILKAANEVAGVDIKFDSLFAGIDVSVQKANQELIELGATDIEFDFNTDDLDEIDDQITQAKRILGQFVNEEAELDLSIPGAESAQIVLANLIYQKQQLTKPDILKFDFSNATSEAGVALATIYEFKTACNELEIARTVGLDTTESQQKVNDLLGKLQELDPKYTTEIGIDPTSIATAEATVNGLTVDKELFLRVGVDPKEVENYQNEDHTTEGEFVWVNNSEQVDLFMKKNLVKNGKVYWYNDGPAAPPSVSSDEKLPMAQGTAYANGKNVGLPTSGEGFGGELGPEILVRDGKFYVIGRNSAEFFKYKKDDIIFNAEQTRQLLKNGKITNGAKRGVSYASGTAFSEGSGTDLRDYIKDVLNNSGSSSGSSSSGSASSNAHDTEDDLEVFDWIEVAIDRISRAVERLKEIATSTYKSLATKLGATYDGIEAVNQQIGIQQKAYNRYMQEANSIGLSSDLIKKVQFGTINITEYDSETQDLISTYQEFYEKAIDASEAVETLHEELAALYEDKFTSIQDDYKNQLELIDRTASGYAEMQSIEEDRIRVLNSELSDLQKHFSEAMNSGVIEQYSEAWYEMQIAINDVKEEIRDANLAIIEYKFNSIQDVYKNQLESIDNSVSEFEHEIDKLEEAGYLSSTRFYAEMQSIEKDRIRILNSELNDLQKHFSEVMNSGEIEQYSEAWYEMQTSINDVKEEIQDANLALIEYNNTMRKIDWEYFDYVQDRISQITAESDFLISLLGYNDLHTNNGTFTNEGLSTVGLHAQNYNVYMAQADKYAKELLEIDKELATDLYNTELIERREELLGLQRSNILSAEEEKQAIVELVREGIEIELNALQELIDKYGEALDNAKSLHDYENKIADHNEEISSLEKQISVYQGNGSEESNAKVQQLTSQLEKARSDLEETEYDQYINDQKKLLDELYLEYEQVLNDRIDNTDALIDEMIGAVNSNSSTIDSTISEAGQSVGYTITDSMKTIWGETNSAITGVVSKYGENFGNQLTSVNLALSAIHDLVGDMVGSSNDESSIDNLARKGIINTPEYWENHKGDLKYLDLLLDKLAGSAGSMEVNSFDNVSDAINFLGNNQVIDTPEYWHNNYAQLPWLEKLLITAANHTLPKYSTGGLVTHTGLAQLDGSKEKPELVLNAQDTENFIALKDALRSMANQGISLGSSTGYSLGTVSHRSGIIDPSSIMPNSLSPKKEVSNSFGDINITIPIEHVQDYNDFVTQLRNDKKFERIVQSITVGRLANESEFAKFKIR